MWHNVRVSQSCVGIVVNLKQFSFCGLANSQSQTEVMWVGLLSGPQPSMHSALKRLLTW